MRDIVIIIERHLAFALRLFHKQVLRIEQHQLGEIFGRTRRINFTGETCADERRQAADMVEVRMRDEHRRDRFRIVGQWFEIFPFGIVAALMQAAVHHNLVVSPPRPPPTPKYNSRPSPRPFHHKKSVSCSPLYLVHPNKKSRGQPVGWPQWKCASASVRDSRLPQMESSLGNAVLHGACNVDVLVFHRFYPFRK